MSTLKSIGPIEVGLHRVLGELLREQRWAAPVFSSRMRPSTAAATALFAVPGRADDQHVLAAEQRELDLGEERLALEEGLLQLDEEPAKRLSALGEPAVRLRGEQSEGDLPVEHEEDFGVGLREGVQVLFEHQRDPRVRG